jgi:TM2 domain-containing membrane protein YozV
MGRRGKLMPLTTQDLMLVEQRVANDSKSVGLAYVLWFFFGFLGGHRFYLGKTGSAVLILCLSLIGLLLSIVFVGYFLLIFVGIWVLIDAFLIPGIARRDKEALRAQLIAELAHR